MKIANITLDNLHVWKNHIVNVRVSRKKRIVVRSRTGETYISEKALETRPTDEQLFGCLLAFNAAEDLYYGAALELETLQLKGLTPPADAGLRGILLDINGVYSGAYKSSWEPLARTNLRTQLECIMRLPLDDADENCLKRLRGEFERVFPSGQVTLV